MQKKTYKHSVLKFPKKKKCTLLEKILNKGQS